MRRLGVLLGKLFCRFKRIKIGSQNFLFTIIFLLLVLVIISFQNQKKLNSLVDHQSKELFSLNESLNSLKNNTSNIQPIIYQPTIEITPTATILSPTPIPTIQVLGDTTVIDSKYLGIIQVKDGISANIHQNPSSDSIILATIPSKSFLFYTEKGINWYKVDLVDSDQNGWVKFEDINEINNE